MPFPQSGDGLDPPASLMMGRMAPDAPGPLLDGKYELVEVAGEGGMATVYRAAVRGAAGFSRIVAVKKIKPEFRAIRNYIDMFVEEARVGSDLNHPNIVQVYDFTSDPAGSYYLVMEWVEGMDLGTFIRAHREHERHIPWPLVAAVGIGTLRGLAAAHDRRRPDGTPSPVIHRDVSPHNILLGANGVVKLTDFGLARARDRVYSLTAPGTVKGKLSYLAPEVSWGKAATPQSDIFTMGSVMFEALSGVRLFDGRSDLEIFKKIRTCAIPPLAVVRGDVPASMIAVIERALAKEPEHRYESAQLFAYALAQVVRQHTNLAGDTQQALSASVLEARKLLGIRVAGVDDQPTWAFDLSDGGPTLRQTGESIQIDVSGADLMDDPVPLTKPKK
jgi:serine/threonine protein kinase